MQTVNNVVSFKSSTPIVAAGIAAEKAVNNTASKAISIAEKYATQETLRKEMMSFMPGPIKFLGKMKSFTGEVPNIIINALGTGLIAPIFIRYNCFSKTDEDTRTYSAIRQPVSAVLAVLTQAGLVIPVDMVINRMSNEGEFKNPNFNKTSFQDVDHIAKQLRKADPSLTKDAAKKLAGEKQLEQLEKLTTQLETTGTIEVISSGKKVKLSADEIKALFEKTSGSMLKQIEESLVRYDSLKPNLQIQRGEYLRNESKKVTGVLKEIKEKTDTINNLSELKKWLETKIKDLKVKKESQELINMVSDIAQRPDVKTIKEKTCKSLERTAAFAQCKSREEVRTMVHSKINEDIKELESQQKLIKEIKAELTSESKPLNFKNIIKKAEGLKETNFSYEVIQKHLSDIKQNIKGKKQNIGLAVSLAIMPLTCCILNYVYPRIVASFFPHLAKKPAKAETDLSKQNQEVGK